MTTLEITATEDETLIELPPGDVELKTPQELVFWSAAPDPSVRQGDHRSEVNRLHGGISVKLGSVPPGWKIAVSLRSDLPAEQPTRPEPPAPEQPPQLSEEEMAARQLARQIAKDMAEAETVNLAVDIIMAKMGKPVAPEPEKPDAHGDVGDEESLTTADLTEEVIQRLTKAKRKKFTELLNVELAELQQERGGPREDLKRENEIEALLGLFARVGEM